MRNLAWCCDYISSCFNWLLLNQNDQSIKDCDDYDESDDDTDTTTTSSRTRRKRPMRAKRYSHWFEQQRKQHGPLNLALTHRLSTIANDDLINFVILPLKIDENVVSNKSELISTPSEFFHSMGFRTLKALGEGGFGLVLLVEKTEPISIDENNIVTVKTAKMACKIIALKDDCSKTNAGSFQSLRAELYILQQLRGQCKYLIHYYEHYVLKHFCEQNQCDMLVAHIFMEYADSGSMVKEVGKYGPLPLSLCRRYFKEMVEALMFLHRHEIAHNDIKLDNVLLVKDLKKDNHKHCKLTDFGLSRFAYKEGVGLLYSNRYMGTRHYMAPEVMMWSLRDRRYNCVHQGKPTMYVPFKADIWSMGVCLYIMITKAFPYSVPKSRADYHVRKFLKKIYKNRFINKSKWKDTYGSCLTSLIFGMLEPNPEVRFTVGTVRSHPWLKSKHRN